MRHMHKTLFFFIMSMLLFSLHSFAGDTGKISGKVVDAETGEPLPGANVIVSARWVEGQEVELEKMTGAASDNQGRFFILNLSPDEYTVRARYMGYTEKAVTQVQVRPDRITKVDFRLSPQTIEGEEITVTAFKKENVQPDLTATRKSYEIKEVVNDVGITDIDDILDLHSGIVDGHFRGSRSGEAKYLLAGAAIVNPLTNERAFSPNVAGLKEVDVYTSGFSAEYGNAQSGVVNMVPQEGQSRWHSRLEFSINSPHYKIWEERFRGDGSKYFQGGSPYARHNMDFYELLKDTTEWLKEDPFNPGHALFDRGYGFGPKYIPLDEWASQWPPPSPEEMRQDSLKIAELARVSWLLADRGIGLDYKKDAMDYDFKFSAGGPIAKNVRLFFAATQTTESEVVPTPEPELNRQLLGNLSYELSQNDKINFIYIFDQFSDHSGYWKRMLFDPELSVSKIDNVSNQYGLTWKHVFNNSSFLNMDISALHLKYRERIELLRTGEFVDLYTESSNWEDYRGPNHLRVGRPEDERGDETSTTYQFHTKYTNQINAGNLLTTGFQFNSYQINVNREEDLTSTGDYRLIKFKEAPFDGALYVEDKMDFEGLIANVGFRFDYYNFNTTYFADEFSPLRNPAYSDTSTVPYYSRIAAEKKKSQLFSNLEPRIGISFPVSEKTVFHLNYGSFLQRPSFNRILYSRITMNEDIIELGNPELKPQTTHSYDIGIVRALPFGFRLDLSAYYKDVKNLIERAYFIDEQQTEYQTFVNRDYADIKGFHIDFERIIGNLRGYIRYNWEAATGKSSNAFNAPITYFEVQDPKYGFQDLPDPEDIYLDFDRTHKIVLKLRYRTEPDALFSIFDVYPLGDLSLTARYRIMSGRPYTWDITGKGLKMNRRTPWEYNLRMRLQKDFEVSNTDFSFYVEGYNLLNKIIWDYNHTFTPGHTAYTRYHVDREDVLTYEEYAPYVTSQEIYLLDNEPRHFGFGFIIKY